jgi:oxygen-independent coproporphyrinogen III oxidase
MKNLISKYNLFGKNYYQQLHLRGSTPTFFSVDNLKFLTETIFSNASVENHPEFSFEGHPNNTSSKHLGSVI